MNIHELPTPCYVIDEKKLKENLEILAGVRDRTECRILLAQKAFSCFYEYPRIADYLEGTTASGLYGGRLAMRRWESPLAWRPMCSPRPLKRLNLRRSPGSATM